MKKLIILITLVLGVSFASFSQVVIDTTIIEQAKLDSINHAKAKQDSIDVAWRHYKDSVETARQQALLDYATEMQEETKGIPRYKMYQTENIHILLKLDTRRGKVWMVQYEMNDTKAMEIPIEYFSIVGERWGWNGRFELYPTKNIYNFIMIDDFDGTTFQVQWDTNSSYRLIKRISD